MKYVQLNLIKVKVIDKNTYYLCEYKEIVSVDCFSCVEFLCFIRNTMAITKTTERIMNTIAMSIQILVTHIAVSVFLLQFSKNQHPSQRNILV